MTAGIHLRPPLRTRPVHKLLHKKLRIPQRLVQPALSVVKIASQPGQYRLRRRLARELLAAGEPAAMPSLVRGFRVFAPGELPGARDAACRCARTFEAEREALTRDADAARGPFVVSVLEGAELCRYPELVRFAVSRPVLDAVTAYLRVVPLLAGAALWWSRPNASARSSQLFHLDDEDRTQLKLFVAVAEIGDEQGPLTFLPADVSQRLRAPIGRMADERLERAGLLGEAVRFVGPAGAAAFVDTSRCLHYGSRANSRERLLLMLQYLRPHAPAESTSSFRVPAALAGLATDLPQRLALGFR